MKAGATHSEKKIGKQKKLFNVIHLNGILLLPFLSW